MFRPELKKALGPKRVTIKFVHSGAVAQRSVHPASPVLLTKNGPHEAPAFSAPNPSARKGPPTPRFKV